MIDAPLLFFVGVILYDPGPKLELIGGFWSLPVCLAKFAYGDLSLVKNYLAS